MRSRTSWMPMCARTWRSIIDTGTGGGQRGFGVPLLGFQRGEPFRRHGLGGESIMIRIGAGKLFGHTAGTAFRSGQGLGGGLGMRGGLGSVFRRAICIGLGDKNSIHGSNVVTRMASPRLCCTVAPAPDAPPGTAASSTPTPTASSSSTSATAARPPKTAK